MSVYFGSIAFIAYIQYCVLYCFVPVWGARGLVLCVVAHPQDRFRRGFDKQSPLLVVVPASQKPLEINQAKKDVSVVFTGCSYNTVSQYIPGYAYIVWFLRREVRERAHNRRLCFVFFLYLFSAPFLSSCGVKVNCFIVGREEELRNLP